MTYMSLGIGAWMSAASCCRFDNANTLRLSQKLVVEGGAVKEKQQDELHVPPTFKHVCEAFQSGKQNRRHTVCTCNSADLGISDIFSALLG